MMLRVQVCLLLVLFALLGWLYAQSVSVDINRLYQLQALLDEASGLDSAMERDMVELRGGHLKHYDGLTSGEKRLDQLQQQVGALLPEEAALGRLYQAMQQAIKQQQEPLAIFVRENKKLLRLAEGVHDRSREPEPKNLTRHAALADLHRDILLYISHPDAELSDHLEYDLHKVIRPLGLAGFERLEAQVKLITRQGVEIDGSVERFIHGGLQEAAAALSTGVEHYYLGLHGASETYRNNALGVGLLLLLYCAYLMFCLRDWSRKLQVANRKLSKLMQAMEQTSDAVCVIDRQGVTQYCNKASSLLSGYTLEELRGDTLYCCSEAVREVEPYRSMWQAMESGRTWRGELTGKRKDGSIYPVQVSISPVCGDQGEVTHFIGVYHDISQQQRLEEQLRQGQKMEAVGTLVGGVAHEFNNMLAGMSGNIYLARMRGEGNKALLQHIDRVDELIFRAGNMIKQMLAFARKGMVCFKPFSYTQMFRDTLALQRVGVPVGITLQADVCEEPLSVDGDASQLQQMLVHLINNACDALYDSTDPSIHIRLASMQSDADWLRSHAGAQAGRYAHLTLCDNGCGMSEEVRLHVFEPFYSTKEVGKGTGLGLSMVYGMVKTHGGEIDLCSETGKGCCIDVYLPLLEEEQGGETSEPVESDQAAMGHGETILLVDDEDQVRKTAARLLEYHGYKVIAAVDGVQGLRCYQQYADAIDLIILDVLMPEMGGVELAGHIRKLNGAARIVYITGYDRGEAMRSGLNVDRDVILSKPFSSQSLLKMVHEQLQDTAHS